MAGKVDIEFVHVSVLSAALAGIVTLCVLYKRYVVRAVMCPSSALLDGQTVVITGANTGIGQQVATELARRGGRIIMACRDMCKAEAAAEEIRELTGSDQVVVEYLDLASLDSIRSFAAHIKESGEHINILINNAAIAGKSFSRTSEGLEPVLCVNYLGPFLLTNLLWDVMIDSSPARIINVAAHTHVFGRIHFGDLMLEKNYSPFRAYCQSKLALVMFTRELARRLEGPTQLVFHLSDVPSVALYSKWPVTGSNAHLLSCSFVKANPQLINNSYVVGDRDQAGLLHVATFHHTFNMDDYDDMITVKGAMSYGTGVTTYAVHPGVTNTQLRHQHVPMKRWILAHLCKTPWQGAQTILYCAVAPELVQESGKYYSNCALSTPIVDAFNDGMSVRLWDMSEELTGLNDIIDIVD